MRLRSWSAESLEDAVRDSSSIRQVMIKLRLVPAGGNYVQISREIKNRKINTAHFTGQGWSKGKTIPRSPMIPTKHILVSDSGFQSFKLKKRLFAEGLKTPACEMCGWAEKSIDGRVPLELDHMNGNRRDNRIENLRVLCPNCHSLQPTHRGRNKARRGGGIGRRV